MLNRLETTYLAILRVLILVVATVALLVAVGACGVAISSFGKNIASSRTSGAGNLDEYIRDRKAAVPTAPSGLASTNETPAGNQAGDSRIREIARDIRDYRGVALPPDAISAQEADLTDFIGKLPVELRYQYTDELKSLAGQLKASKGTKLDPDGIADLMQWHQNKFVARAEKEVSDKAARTAAAGMAFYVAGYAFMLFIVVIFTFLFVKVERSLRVVRVVREGGVDA